MSAPPGPPEFRSRRRAPAAGFRAALEDDLNTSVALAALHEFVTTVNRTARQDATAAIAVLRDADRVFGDARRGAGGGADDAEIERLVAEREAARKARDFKRADALRDELSKRGIELLDSPQGTRWRRK